MRVCALFLAVFVCIVDPCRCQTAGPDKLSPQCRNRHLISESVPLGPYKILPGETYKQSPRVKFQINEGGTVSNVKLTRGSGIKDLDGHVLRKVSAWKFKPAPGCVFDSEVTILIHWD
jgi:TonB family protein